MARGFEAAHSTFTLPCWLVRVLRLIIQTLVLAMLGAWHDYFLCGLIAGQFVGDDDSRNVLESFEQLAKEPFRRLFVAPTLHKDIQHVAMLIDGSPQVRPFPVDRQKDFIQVPLVSTQRTAAEFICIYLTKLQREKESKCLSATETHEHALPSLPIYLTET
jgi:hypothetical protein